MKYKTTDSKAAVFLKTPLKTTLKQLLGYTKVLGRIEDGVLCIN